MQEMRCKACQSSNSHIASHTSHITSHTSPAAHINSVELGSDDGTSLIISGMHDIACSVTRIHMLLSFRSHDTDCCWLSATALTTTPANFGKNSGASSARTRGSTDDDGRDADARSLMYFVSNDRADALREGGGGATDDASRRAAATMLRALNAT